MFRLTGAGELHVRQLPQLIVDLRQRLFGGQQIAGFNLRQDVSHVRHETKHIDTGEANPLE